MSLYDRFECAEMLRDGGVKSFAAREKATNRRLEIHLLVDPATIGLLAHLDRMPEERRRAVIARGEHEGTPYVVTEPLPAHWDFESWVEAGRLESAGAWRVMVPARPNKDRSLDEQFASLFETEPGEFTRMFQAMPAAPAPAVAPANADPGEFTRFFQSPLAAGPLGQTPAAPSTPRAEAGAEPGEFTRMFGAVSAPAPAPAAQPPAAPPPATATQAFSVPAPAAPAVSQPQAPGEATRMFAQAAPLTLGQSAPDVSPVKRPEPARSARASRLPLILAMAAMGILILTLLVYLALRTKLV